MADETVSFSFTDSGTINQLLKLLDQLGVSGELVAQRLASGYLTAEQSAIRLEASQQLVNVALAAGLPAAGEFADALKLLSTGQLVIATSTPQLTAAIAAFGAEVGRVAAATAALDAAAAATVPELEAVGAAAQVAATGLEGGRLAAANFAEGMAASSAAAGVFNSRVGAASAAAATTAPAFNSASEAVTAFRTAQAFTTAGAINFAGGLTTIRNASTSLKDAIGEVSSAFGGLGGILTAAIGGAALAKDIDGVQQVNKQLALLGESATQQSADFDRLVAAANNAQTPLTTVANTFGQVNAGLEKYGLTASQAIDVTGNLSRLFFVTGTTALGAQRALHDFAEGLSQGHLQGQQLLSFERQAPQAFAQFASFIEKQRDATGELTGKTLTLKEALSGQNLALTTSSAAFATFANTLGAGASTAGTISGAFTVLNNQFEDFLDKTGAANTTVALVTAALGALGNNLNIVVPVMAAFVALLAFNGIESAIASVGRLGLAMYETAAAFTAADAAMAPFAAAVGIVATAVVLLAAKLGILGGDPLHDAISGLQNLLGAFVGTANAAEVDTSKITDNSKAKTDAATKAAALRAEVEKLAGSQNGDTSATNTNTSAIKANTAAKEENAQASYSAAQAAAIGSNAYASSLNGGVNQGGSSSGGGGTQPSFVQSLPAQPGNSIIQDLGASRVGSSFTVPGSSGVDSKIIHVSPGEHVTIQTPMQRALGVVNPTTPANGKFRDGGYASGASFHAVSGGVTGYGLINPSDYNFTSQGTIYSQQSIDATNAAAASAAAAAAANAALAAAQSAASAAASVASSAASTASSSSAANDNSSGTTSNDKIYKGAVGNVGGGTTSYATGAVQPTAAQGAAYNKKIAEDQKALHAAGIITSVNGVSRPADPVDGGVPISTAAQAENWVYQVGTGWVPRGNAGNVIKTAGDVQAAYATLLADQKAGVKGFREGGSFVVPGATGVDSRIIQMSVSPGEEVAVKTREQQAQSRPQNSGGQTINMYVTTPDADSFRKSSAQLASDTKRKLLRTA